MRALKAAWPALELAVVDGATHVERDVKRRPEFVQAIRERIAAHPRGM